METEQAVTQYVNILLDALRKLHAAYPDQRVALNINERETNGWQISIKFFDPIGVHVGGESFYINPPGIP